MVKIPSRLEELLPLGAFERVLDSLHRPELSQKVREAVSKVGLKELNPLGQVQEAWQQARTWLETLAGGDVRISTQVINASGAMFIHDSEGVPMTSSISLSLAKAASSFLDRQHCLKRSTDVVKQCLGINDHVWLAEPAVALNIAVKTQSTSGVLVPRSDCVRIPGLGDLHTILTQQGIPVTEVGATNGATQQDWQNALTAEPGKAIVTSTLNALPTQQAMACRQSLLNTAQAFGTSVIELLVDGSPDSRLCQLYGFPAVNAEFSGQNRTALLPAHFLLGGARGVLCWGDMEACKMIQQRASLMGGELNSAAIVANLLALQLACLDDELERGMVGMLELNPENLRNRSQRLATQLTGNGPIITAELLDSQHPLGPSPWDRYTLFNPVVRLQVQDSPLAFLESMKLGKNDNPAVLLRSFENSLAIDLRFVSPDDDHKIVLAVKNMA